MIVNVFISVDFLARDGSCRVSCPVERSPVTLPPQASCAMKVPRRDVSHHPIRSITLGLQFLERNWKMDGNPIRLPSTFLTLTWIFCFDFGKGQPIPGVQGVHSYGLTRMSIVFCVPTTYLIRVFSGEIWGRDNVTFVVLVMSMSDYSALQYGGTFIASVLFMLMVPME